MWYYKRKIHPRSQESNLQELLTYIKTKKITCILHDKMRKIIHYRIRKKLIKETLYVCNQCCAANPEKSTRDHKKVTCKNCLHILMKHEKTNKKNS